jgi:hypothetical protein
MSSLCPQICAHLALLRHHSISVGPRRALNCGHAKVMLRDALKDGGIYSPFCKPRVTKGASLLARGVGRESFESFQQYLSRDEVENLGRQVPNRVAQLRCTDFQPAKLVMRVMELGGGVLEAIAEVSPCLRQPIVLGFILYDTSYRIDNEVMKSVCHLEDMWFQAPCRELQ